MDTIVVLITAPNEEEGAAIAKALVQERLAGCVTIIKEIRSLYIWEGNIEDEKEVLMVAKTQKSLFERLSQKVKELHRYTVPEIIAIPVIAGSEDYLRWLEDVTG